MSTINSASDLLEAGEIADIRIFEISASIKDEVNSALEEDEVSQKIEIRLGAGEHTIEIRVRATVETSMADYQAVCAMQFKYQSDTEPSEHVVREFAERAGIGAVYPYLREAIQGLSVKLGQPPITMPFLQLGSVNLESTEDD